MAKQAFLRKTNKTGAKLGLHTPRGKDKRALQTQAEAFSKHNVCTEAFFTVRDYLRPTRVAYCLSNQKVEEEELMNASSVSVSANAKHEENWKNIRLKQNANIQTNYKKGNKHTEN